MRNTAANARFYEVDVTKLAMVVAAAERVPRDHGGVDVLVNNADIGRLGPSMTYPLEDRHASLDVMATGVFLRSGELGKACGTAAEERSSTSLCSNGLEEIRV